jgi:drug/metabolite transporter (DMT)-like permease
MNKTILAVLLVLLGGSSYGFVSTAVKFAYQANFQPEDVTGAQFLSATVLLAFLLLIRREPFWRMSRKELGILGILGLLSTGTSVFYYESLHFLPASLAIVFLFQFSWIIVIIDFLFTRRFPSRAKVAGIGIIFLGTLLAVDLLHTDLHHVSVIGILLGCLSGVTYAAFLYGTSFLQSDSGPFGKSAIINLVSTILIFMVFPPHFLWNGALAAGLWKWGLLIGILSQVIPTVFFNIGIPVIGGAVAGVLGAIELPVSVVASHFILGEHVEPLRWLGVGLILLGIVVSEGNLTAKKCRTKVNVE